MEGLLRLFSCLGSDRYMADDLTNFKKWKSYFGSSLVSVHAFSSGRALLLSVELFRAELPDRSKDQSLRWLACMSIDGVCRILVRNWMRHTVSSLCNKNVWCEKYLIDGLCIVFYSQCVHVYFMHEKLHYFSKLLFQMQFSSNKNINYGVCAVLCRKTINQQPMLFFRWNALQKYTSYWRFLINF